jgi:predicted nuclease with RNAse H fold
VPQILAALPHAVEGGLRVPLVYNTSAYDSLDSLRLLDGIVDVYMPDLKLLSREHARAYLKRGDYSETALVTIKEMHRQVGDLVLDRTGLARRGVILRHLVMPGMLEETEAILRWIAEELGTGCYVNLMAQYHPSGKVGRDGRCGARPAPPPRGVRRRARAGARARAAARPAERGRGAAARAGAAVSLCIGVDVSTTRFHGVAIDDRRRVRAVWLFGADELERAAEAFRGAAVVAVDAPASLSTLPHESEGNLSAKFRLARCAEIALGLEYGYWVPFVAPSERSAEGWMATGFAVYEELARAGLDTIEVFPYAGYRSLAAGRPLPKKTSLAGIRARLELLGEAGIAERDLQMWSHDGLDALLGALVALDHVQGRAHRVSCGHDGSAIWLPAA